MAKPAAANLRAALDYYRAMRRSSLEEVSAEIGISKDALHRFERGKEVSGTAIYLILLWLLK